MEIYRQRINKVEFEVPRETDVVYATIALNGGEPAAINSVIGNGSGTRLRSIEIPYIDDEGTLTVEWSWQGSKLTEAGIVENYNNIQKDTYDVVTPILSDIEIREIHPQATQEEVFRIERATRHVINAFTGQRFGRYTGEYSVRGNGGSLLQLPARLLSATTINGLAPNNWFSVENDGWALRLHKFGAPPVKADFYGYHQHPGGVIHNPYGVKPGVFDESRKYVIDGSWGWEEVPSAVREAAKLLVNDYACADAQYRDRYLTSMTAADWRIQFNAGAFTKTGNVRADQLLSGFVLNRGWAVL